LPEDLGTDPTIVLDKLNPVTCGRKHRYEDLRDIYSFETGLEVKTLLLNVPYIKFASESRIKTLPYALFNSLHQAASIFRN
jgi:hypothetical protein